MATNPHFQHFDATNEQYLVQDLIIESIKIYGHDVYYMPRTLVNEDTLYSEDTISAFNDAYVVEMYIKNVDGFEGEGDFMSRFGLEIRDQITFSVAQRTFKNLLLDSTYDRPKEGDIIYFPLTKKVFVKRGLFKLMILFANSFSMRIRLLIQELKILTRLNEKSLIQLMLFWILEQERIPLEKQSIKELIWLVQIQPQKLSVGLYLLRL